MKCGCNYRKGSGVLLLFFVLLFSGGYAESLALENETVGRAVSTSMAPTREELENALYSGFEGCDWIKGAVRLI